MTPIVRNGPFLEALSLKKGNHQEIEKQFCVMEAVAYVAGEPWSDAPKCACQVITQFMVNWNDSLPDDATRDRLLKPLIPLLVDSRSTKTVEKKRGWMAFDWLVREHAAAWMDLTPALVIHAQALRALPIINADSIALCMPVFQAAHKASAAAGAAVWDAAWDAAGDAARAAARAAARDAAWAAAWDAAGAALKPTIERLQLSAQDLVRRMCEVKS